MSDDIQDELEESEIINRKFKQLLNNRDNSQSQSQKVKFDKEEQDIIIYRFSQLCSSDNRMSYNQFRRGLGLLGREDSFICRIFNLIDKDNDGFITEDNYIQYLNVILKGTQLEKAKFGWLILTQGKGNIEFVDFMELFQQLSVVWNALTGQIVKPKRKYIQELFNILDVDQDQTITFPDYRLFFDEKLEFSGWFQYFNQMDFNWQASKAQLQKVREKLSRKLKVEQRYKKEENVQLKMLLQDTQKQVKKRLFQLTSNLLESSTFINRKYQLIHKAQQQQLPTKQKITSKSKKSSTTQQEQESTISMKRFNQYKYTETVRQSEINKMQMRRNQINIQSKVDLNRDVKYDLQVILDMTCRMMDLCQNYRSYKERQKQQSPAKLKQMQAKLKIIKSEEHKQNNRSKNQKMTIYFGHSNWNLALSIMVGMRKSIKALYPLNLSFQIKDHHFQEKHSFILGNKGILSSGKDIKQMESFFFTEMAPIIFEKLRSVYGISNDDYQRSVGPQSLLNQLLTGNLTALNQKCSTGKSGSFFYITSDNKVFLKTIRLQQFKTFMRILKDYYEHMLKNPNTLIVRIYGLYKLKIYINDEKINTIYFISMENIFSQINREEGVAIEEVYDIKGSLYGRTGSLGNQLKDNDWVQRNKKISLPPHIANIFRNQIIADSQFFKNNNSYDYSLMIAFVKYNPKQTSKQSGNIFKSLRGGVISKVPGTLMVLTIIDILTSFQTLAKLQNFFKTTFLSKDVSCVPPSDYCERFQQFICNSIQ